MILVQEVTANLLYYGFALALVLSIIYVVRQRAKVAFLNVAGIILTSQASLGGASLCYKSLSSIQWELTQSERIYVFIGGLAVTWNAVTSISKLISK